MKKLFTTLILAASCQAFAGPDDLRAGWTAVDNADGTRLYQVTCTTKFEGQLDTNGDMIEAQCAQSGAVQSIDLLAERARNPGHTKCSEFWPDNTESTCYSVTRANYWTDKDGQYCFAAVAYLADEESEYSPITCRTVAPKLQAPWLIVK